MFQGLFLVSQDGIPRIFCGSDAVASGLSSPQKPQPQLRVKQAGKGPRKGELGVCLSKPHDSELVANYSFKYSLVLIIQVEGNGRNTGETQPH